MDYLKDESLSKTTLNLISENERRKCSPGGKEFYGKIASLPWVMKDGRILIDRELLEMTPGEL
jgi:hypothetical protein